MLFWNFIFKLKSKFFVSLSEIVKAHGLSVFPRARADSAFQ